MDFDLVPILAILIGGLIVLVPIAGLTLRFALKPALDSFLRGRELLTPPEELRRLEQRLAAVEAELRRLSVERAAGSIGPL